MAAQEATEATNSEEEEVERCAICIHDIAPGNVAQVVPCLHYYWCVFFNVLISKRLMKIAIEARKPEIRLVV